MRLSTRSFEIGTFIKEQIDEIITCYPVIAEVGATGNFAVYRKTGYTGSNSKDRFNFEERINIEIYVVANTYKESVELAQNVKEKVENFRGIWKDTIITDMSLDNANEDYIDGNYVQRMYFTITIDINRNKR